MKDETRRAALRAAQAVALGAMAACTSTTSTTTPAPAEGTNSTGPAACMALLDGAFSDGDRYPYPMAKASPHPAVQQCCQQSLATFFARRTPDPLMERHRWACCASVDTRPEHIAAACTPWGPPVPPPMGRASGAARRRRISGGG